MSKGAAIWLTSPHGDQRGRVRVLADRPTATRIGRLTHRSCDARDHPSGGLGSCSSQPRPTYVKWITQAQRHFPRNLTSRTRERFDSGKEVTPALKLFIHEP